MRRSVLGVLTMVFAAGLMAGCPPQKPGGPGGGGSSVNAEACGEISTSEVGRKLYSFLKASAELDRATFEMETSVKTACQRMATELGVSTEGDTREVCNRAVKELEANLEISVSTETRLVTRYSEPVCTTDIDFSASVVAECEAKLEADVSVTCDGYCGGSCSGECEGNCSGSTGAGGSCDGVCEGSCRGSCSADCQGYADVDASLECKASAEVRASINTTCTEPKLEVVQEDVTIVDDSKFQKAMAAIDAGLPTILQIGAKAELVAKALVAWVQTGAKLVKASGDLFDALGDKALCAAGQITAAVAAAAQIEARISVSIEVSASVSASAGATAQ